MDRHVIQSTSLRFTLSFVVLAIIGSLLLAMPIMHQPGIQVSFSDHFITSVSLVCVSGLGAVSIGDTYNFLGQLLCLILIQVGGLGIITLINVGMYRMHRHVSLKDQYLLQSTFGRDTNQDFSEFLLAIYRYTMIAELIGTGLLMIAFVPRFGWFKGSFHALFVAVASFTNAGFHNFGGSGSLEAFNNNPLVLLTVCALVIFGGIGFTVWFELAHKLRDYWNGKPRSIRLAFHNLSTHTYVVLRMTVWLLISGTLVTWFVEARNPKTMTDWPAYQQLLNAFFKTVCARTAGFTSLNYVDLRPFSKFHSMMQTIIGGAPGGTAGGMKVTTVAIMLALVRSELLGYERVVIHRRTITSSLIKKALVVITFFALMIFAGYSTLLIMHPEINALDLLFEVFNALGTAGISLNLTNQLSTAGHFILIILMIAGRVGPITLLMGLMNRQKQEIHYPKTDIYLG